LSRQGAINGIEAAIARGTLRAIGSGKRGAKLYQLVIQDDQSTQETSQPSRPVDETTSQPSRPVKPSTSQPSRHTKERIPKENKKERKDSGANAPKESNPVFDAVALEVFGIKDASALNGSASSVGSLAASVKRLYTAQFGEYDINKAAISVNHFVARCKKDSKFVPQYKAQFEPKYLAFLQNQIEASTKPAPRDEFDDGYVPTTPENRASPEQLAESKALRDALFAKFGGGK
jgi:hypothetical protein